MQLRSGKIVNDKPTGSDFKDKPAKLRSILREIRHLLDIAVNRDGNTVYERLSNVYNLIKYIFTHLYILYKDVSLKTFLYTLYLKAHEVICQTHDLENKYDNNPLYSDLSQKIISMSMTIIGRLEKLLQFSYK
uniref:Uncharacterized protein n=1 Tax=viral metagenome TaxID=1070528 RepID=A0A6C0HBQ1_9ZZZZ